MVLPHEQDVTERYFSHKFQTVQAKMKSRLNLTVSSLICLQKIHAPRTYKH